MSDTDLIKLYSAQILQLASDIPLLGKLDAPDASVRRRSPLCGSTLTVEISMTDGKISQYAQDVKACALGQASASVVGANVIGCTPDQILLARNELLALLKSGGTELSAPFAGLNVLLPARDFKNRHASIMLALEATLEATDQSQKAACA